MSGPEPIWSEKISLDDIPETGAHFDLAADEPTRAALAQAAGLRTLPRLAASFDVTRQGQDSLRVAGDVTASVGQNCVVTLEPIESDLHEIVDLVFSPPRSARPDEAGETTVGFAQDEPPETLVGGEVDLGAVATEFLLLGIDPYPRKPDASFENMVTGDPAARPFAALAALQKRKNGDKT